MKFKNLDEETVRIITKDGIKTANTGEIIELDEKTYSMVKTIYTKLELVVEPEKPTVKPVVENPFAIEPKAKENKKCK